MKWVTITAQARSLEDFELLTRMLDALGFRPQAREHYGSIRLQSFSPSRASLEVVHRENRREYPELELTISDPDSAVEIVKRMGLHILEDDSGPKPKHSVRDFSVQLPGGTYIRFRGLPGPGWEIARPVEGSLDARGKRFGIVVSRFNSFITERLLAGTVDGLLRCGLDSDLGYEIVRVPGSFEIPSAARTLAETKKYDAIICLGCLLRGDTAHYDVIVNEVARGIGQSAEETGVPHAFGVLTCDTLEQAIDRAGLKMGNKGFEAALAAVEMANLKQAIRTQHAAVSKGVVSRRSSVIGKIAASRQGSAASPSETETKSRPQSKTRTPAASSKKRKS
jgi:6,7-dimethyl-8-ribityllumazine synthase